MVRALALSLLVVTALGVAVAPGLAAVALLLVPFIVLVVAWWIAFAASSHGRRAEAVARVRHREFLGPGGPDDPFAGDR